MFCFIVSYFSVTQVVHYYLSFLISKPLYFYILYWSYSLIIYISFSFALMQPERILLFFREFSEKNSFIYKIKGLGCFGSKTPPPLEKKGPPIPPSNGGGNRKDPKGHGLIFSRLKVLQTNERFIVNKNFEKVDGEFHYKTNVRVIKPFNPNVLGDLNIGNTTQNFRLYVKGE